MRCIPSLWLLLLVGLSTLAVVSTALAEDDPDEIISNLQRKYNSIRDASVSFTQHVQFSVTKAEQTFKGKFLMKKGNKYRIEMDQQTSVTDLEEQLGEFTAELWSLYKEELRDIKESLEEMK